MQIVAMLLALLVSGLLPGEAIAHGLAHQREQAQEQAYASVVRASAEAPSHRTALAAPDLDHHHDLRLSVSSPRIDVPVMFAIVVHVMLAVPVVSIPAVRPTDRDDHSGGNATRGPPPKLRAPPSLV